MQYILLFCSIILYCIAPTNTYDLSICIKAFSLFLLGAFWGIYKLRKIEFFGFNLLFSVSFFSCCYIFPIFIYNIDDTFSLFHHGYDYRVMTKATCLASMAYSVYLCGMLQKIGRLSSYKANNNSEKIQIIDTYINPNNVTKISIIFFIVFICLGGYSFLNNMYSEGEMSGGAVSYAYVLLSLIPVLLTYVMNCSFSKKFIIISLVFVIFFLVTGSRTIPLSLILGVFYVYSLQHKIPKHIIVTFLFIGIILMAILGATRGGQEVETESEVGFWAAFLDLIICNRNLFDSLSFVQAKGFVPTVLLGPILAVIPMSQSLFCMLTGVPNSSMSSALYITVENFGSNPPIGLGTNVVGDVYLAGGISLTLFLFYFLGYFISKSLYKIHVEKNFIWFIFYIALIVNGIFICRGSFFLFLRPFVWSLVVLSLLKTKVKNESIIHKRSV